MKVSLLAFDKRENEGKNAKALLPEAKQELRN